MDLAAIGAAYTGLKFAKDTLQVVLASKVDAETRTKIADALERLGTTQDTLFEVREELFRLQSENERLRNDLKARDDWESRKAQYPITPTAGGAIVRVSTGEQRHFVCPSCFETYHEPQPLQDRRVAAGLFDCPRCKTAYPVGIQSMAVPTVVKALGVIDFP